MLFNDNFTPIFDLIEMLLLQLTNIYIISLLFASASTNYLYLSIPNELLIHGPIILNVSNAELRVKPIVCNPHFKLFRENYLTESLKNQEEVSISFYLPPVYS